MVVVLMVIVGSASFSGCLKSCFRDCSGAYFCGCWWLLVAVFVVVGGFWWLFFVESLMTSLQGQQKRVIKHCSFTSWPDMKV